MLLQANLKVLDNQGTTGVKGKHSSCLSWKTTIFPKSVFKFLPLCLSTLLTSLTCSYTEQLFMNSYTDSICFRFLSWASSLSWCLRYSLIWKNKRMKNCLLFLTVCSMVSHPHTVMILRIKHYSYVLTHLQSFLIREFLRVSYLLAV